MRCFETLWDTEVSLLLWEWDIMRRFETFWDVLRCLKTLWDIMRHFETLWDNMRHGETQRLKKLAVISYGVLAS